MKPVFYFFGVLLIVNSSCRKDNRFKHDYYGTASATINGVSWKSNGVRCGADQPCFNGKLFIEFNRHNEQGYLRESIGFAKFTSELGQKKVYLPNYQNACNDTLQGSYTTLTADGDAVKDFYDLIPVGENYFTIERYKERTKEIWGSFQATFIKRPRQNPYPTPDTIRITNGKFHTRIQK